MKTVSIPIQERPKDKQRILFPLKALNFVELVEVGEETDRVSCWYLPAVERRRGSRAESNRGLFALETIPRDTLVAIKHRRALSDLRPEEIDSNRVGYNHSSEPNAEIVPVDGASLDYVVVREPLSAGEEITVDLLGRDGVQ